MESLASSLPGPRRAAVAAARATIEEHRALILAGERPPGEADLLARAERRAHDLRAGSLRPVINATGVILHTNLGRAPLAPAAAQAAAEIAVGYSTLEFDLAEGARGSRHTHVEEPLLALSGAEAAIAVNNNAAAVLLALAATSAGREVIVGRDQLIEIGGSFRIPEILSQSGAVLVEVGTTNRTRAADYAEAIGPHTGALLRVHQSNFRTTGFTESVPLADLCELGRERGVPVIDDLGSGALHPIGDEPLLRSSIATGAELVCCSGDKLLGGPQAGIIAGSEASVNLCRSHPLARALRLDKLQIAALAATLRLHRDEGPGAIPALSMMTSTSAELTARANLIAEFAGAGAIVVSSSSRPGGGTLPTTRLEGPACSVSPGAGGADALIAALRAAEPPVIARIEDDRVLLDPRTMSDDDARVAGHAVRKALG